MSVKRYYPVDQRTDQDTRDFIIWSGPASVLTKATLLQNGTQSGDILSKTLMAKRASTQKWEPFINEAAINGGAIPQGIYIGPDLAEADIQAGDIENIIVLVHDARFDEDQLIIENGKTLETVITVGTTDLRTVRDYLRSYSLIPIPTKITSGGSY